MKQDKIQGAKEILFRDLGRSMHYFKGAREHILPLGVLKDTLTDKCLASFLWDIGKLYRPRSDAAKRGHLIRVSTDRHCLLTKYSI